MASAFSHAMVVLALGKGSSREIITWRTLFLGMICSALPDIDVVGFRYGIPYGSLWGHRGMTHSLFFAALLSAFLMFLFYSRKPASVMIKTFIFILLCTASHGLLDALTNGGLAVAFFSPFDTTRYFFPFRPIVVASLNPKRFFSEQAQQVWISEFNWVWIPSILLMSIMSWIKTNKRKYS